MEFASMNKDLRILPPRIDPSEWVEACKKFMAQLIEFECEPDLNERRERAIEWICREFDADFGFWSWGQGHPEGEEIVLPVAMIPWGLDEQKRATFFRIGMRPESNEWFRFPFLPLLMQNPQACRACPHFWTTEQWQSSAFRMLLLQETELDQWMTCIRYPNPQLWSCVSLFRKTGKPPFSDLQCLILDIACAGISWLQSDATRLRKDTSIVGLSPRNTEVLYMLLDGQSRKEIAHLLGLTTHVVNDSLKQIYNHFGTTSATELAALFLKRA